MEEDTTSIALLYSGPTGTGSCGAADKHDLVTLTPDSLDVGVDVGAIARALGLSPSTVRLNGHLLGVPLGAGGGWVSSVTWRSLLAFFSSHGHPTGAAGDPVLVQGKVQSPGTERAGPCTQDHPSISTKITLKRKITTQDSCQVKKRRSGDLQDGDDDGILCLKRKLRLESNKGLKRAKTAVLCPKAVSGLFAADSEPPILCSDSCVAEHLERSHQKACSSS